MNAVPSQRKTPARTDDPRERRIRRRKSAVRAVLISAGFLAVFSAFGCAGIPTELPEVGIAPEARTLTDGLEIIEGRGWKALRADLDGELELAMAFCLDEAGRTRGAHLSFDLGDPSVAASMVGSPHRPIRFRAGLPQAVSGYFRADGETLSGPDGKHDALGIDDEGKPLLLRPEEQDGRIGTALAGFYAILAEGVVLSPVETRDAVGAVGWSEGGDTVFFFVSRGRKGRGYSYGEAGEILKRLGADGAIAMDGGGSARLVWREGDEAACFPAKPMYRAVPNRVLLRHR